MKQILKYFPQLSQQQQQQLAMLDELYRDWNAKINVISRKDIDHLYEHHVLHSMAIAKMINFRPGTRILDFGTGGGFPGIPLAILFPECHFKLIDQFAISQAKLVDRAVCGNAVSGNILADVLLCPRGCAQIINLLFPH